MMATLRGPLVLVTAILSSATASAWAQQCEGRDWVEEHIRSRASHAMAYDTARGVAVLFGGFDGTKTIADTWEWDGSAWKLRATTGPANRHRHAMAYDSARGVTVLFGGGCRPRKARE